MLANLLCALACAVASAFIRVPGDVLKHRIQVRASKQVKDAETARLIN
jgi:hypothetical protein